MVRKKTKIGLIGAGKISEIHLKTIMKNPVAEVIAICDVDEKRAKQQAKKYRIDHVYSEWQDLLKDKNVQLVHILLPNFLHAKISIEALKNGKDVLCEKPLTISVNEVKRIKESLKKINKKVFVKHYNRFSKAHIYAKKLISEGKIGDIYLVKGTFKANNEVRNVDLNNWKTNPKLSGGGILLDYGVHCIDYVNSIIGKPESVYSVCRSPESKLLKLAENLSCVIIKYPRTLFSLTCDSSSVSDRTWWTKEFYGTKGKIILKDKWKKSVIFQYFEGEKLVEEFEEKSWWENANRDVINDIINRVNSGKKPLISLKEIEVTMKIIFGAYKSSQKGKEVKIK